MKRLALFLLFASACYAQIATKESKWNDNGTAISPKNNRNVAIGTTCPGGAPAGSVCAGGKVYSGGAEVSGVTDFTATVDAGTDTVTISAGRARFDNIPYDLTSATAVGPTGAGNVYFYVDGTTHALAAGKGVGITSAGTLTSIGNGGDVTTPFWPSGSIPIAVCTVASSNYDTCSSYKAYLAAFSGTGASAGAANAVQTSDGSGGFVDSGCTATGGEMTCSGGFSSSTAFEASGAEQAKPTAPAAGSGSLWFDSTAHVPQYQGSAGTLAATMVVPAASRTANQFVTHVPSTGIPATAAIADGDVPSNITRTIASAQTAMPTAEIAANACSASATTATATGAATTDTVVITYASDPTGVTGYGAGTNGGITVRAWPTANTANFKLCNETGSPITPGALSINWRVVR